MRLVDREDGKLMSQNNHLVWVWTPSSLIVLGWGVGGLEEVKTIILQIPTEMANLREGMWPSLPAEGQGSLRRSFCMIVMVQLLSPVRIFRSHGLQLARLPCHLLCPWVCSNSYPLSWWYHSTIPSSVAPFSSRSRLNRMWVLNNKWLSTVANWNDRNLELFGPYCNLRIMFLDLSSQTKQVLKVVPPFSSFSFSILLALQLLSLRPSVD